MHKQECLVRRAFWYINSWNSTQHELWADKCTGDKWIYSINIPTLKETRKSSNQKSITRFWAGNDGDAGSELVTGGRVLRKKPKHRKSPAIFHLCSQWRESILCTTHPDGGNDNWCSKLNEGFLQLPSNLCVCECFCVFLSSSHKKQSSGTQSDARFPGSSVG